MRRAPREPRVEPAARTRLGCRGARGLGDQREAAGAGSPARSPAASAEQAAERAWAAAVRALARRARSAAEIEAWLGARGFAEPAVQATLVRLRERGWLDEAAVADAVMRDAARRRLGSRRVACLLERRGVAPEVAAEAAAASAAADVAAAREALARRFPRGVGADPRQLARALRWLGGRGFPAGAARQALGIDVDRESDLGLERAVELRAERG